MNCVQCGEELPASAKFCKKCGCKVQISEAPKAASRGLLPALTPAYTTCPDCGALCKADARFCNKCGCRFEDMPSFEDTKRDWTTPLTKDEEKAILVFGNVQDSSSPAPSLQVDTSPAMVIGGGAAVAGSVAAVPAPSLRPVDSMKNGAPALSKTSSARPVAQAMSGAAASAKAAPSVSVAPPANVAKSTHRNPMPEPVPAPDGPGKWIALGVLALAVLIAGGAWWWGNQAKHRGVRAPASSPLTTVVPAPVIPPSAELPAESALTLNETIEPAQVVDPAVEPVVVEAAVIEQAPAATPAAQEPPPARPAPRKPVRKQTLDDLLN